MTNKLTAGYVVYWTYPNDNKLRNTTSFQNKDDAVRMSDDLQKDGMVVNYISYRS